MIDLDKLTLAEKIRLYAEGDDKTGFPPHGFDFTREDTDKMLKAIRDSGMLQALVDTVTCVSEVAENIKNGGRIE